MAVAVSIWHLLCTMYLHKISIFVVIIKNTNYYVSIAVTILREVEYWRSNDRRKYLNSNNDGMIPNGFLVIIKLDEEYLLGN